MNHPEHPKYAKTHEWALVENNVVISGISDHAQDSLGDLVYVELPVMGQVYKQGEQIGVVESVKTASDIHAPVTGKVIEINTALEDDAEIINTDPYIEGWIYKMEPVDLNEMDELLDAEEYEHSID